MASTTTKGYSIINITIVCNLRMALENNKRISLVEESRIFLRPALIRFIACAQIQKGIKTLGKSGLIVEKVTK